MHTHDGRQKTPMRVHLDYDGSKSLNQANLFANIPAKKHRPVDGYIQIKVVSYRPPLRMDDLILSQ